jgi:hypothetical protein
VKVRRLAIAAAALVFVASVGASAFLLNDGAADSAGSPDGVTEAQAAQVRTAIGSLTPPLGFSVVPCIDLGAPDVCWRGKASPEEAARLAATVMVSVGVERLESECADSPTANGRPLGCWVAGEVAGRRVTAVAFRDLNPDAKARSDAFAETSTVAFTGDLAP